MCVCGGGAHALTLSCFSVFCGHFDVTGEKGDLGEKGQPGSVGFTGTKGERGFKGLLRFLCIIIVLVFNDRTWQWFGFDWHKNNSRERFRLTSGDIQQNCSNKYLVKFRVQRRKKSRQP